MGEAGERKQETEKGSWEEDFKWLKPPGKEQKCWIYWEMLGDRVLSWCMVGVQKGGSWKLNLERWGEDSSHKPY